MASMPGAIAPQRGERSPKLTSCEPVDLLSCNTLKRHPKMDLNKTDMLQLLSYLEGELQARDVVIATLKAEKAKHFLYEAKYGRFGGLGDPCHALQRDSELNADTSFDESAVRAMYDDQLTQLDNLIVTQHRAQQQMREQLSAIDKRYHKVCIELEEEKTKHARDMEQGDNVTYMLEKDRERLKQELEFEKCQNKKLERELKRAVALHEEEHAASLKHKQVALMLIRGRVRLVQSLTDLKLQCAALEGAAEEARRAEAASEERHVEIDFECEQLRARLARAEAQNRDLRMEIDRLRNSGAVATAAAAAATAGRPTASHPHVYISERTVSPTPLPPSCTDVRRMPAPVQPQKLSPETDVTGGGGSRTIQQVVKKTPAAAVSHDGTAVNNVMSSSSDMTAKPAATSHILSPMPGSIGPAISPPRKPAPAAAARGVPPPVPPNKPQVVISPQPQGNVPRPLSVNVQSVMKPNAAVATTPKDRTSVSSADGVSNVGVAANRGLSPRPAAPSGGGMHSVTAVRSDIALPTAVRKPSPATASGQVCVNIKSQVG